MRDIELRHFRYFLAVAEEKHFGRAAERLGIAQPPLSQQIQRLEEMLGEQLFERRPRVRLTAAGEALLQTAPITLARAEYAVEAARRAGEGRAGTLTVGLPASALLTALPTAVRHYREKFPEVEVRLRELSSAAQVDALLDGSIDVGFLRQAPTDLPELTCERWLNEAFSLVVPQGHHLSGKRSIKLARLAEEPFVLFPRAVAPGLYEQVHGLCRQAGFSPTVVQEAQEWLTIVGLVEAGIGISIVPDSFRRLRWGGVQYLKLQDAQLRTEIFMCQARASSRPTAFQFLHLARRLAQEERPKP